jgi:hypothetical protein
MDKDTKLSLIMKSLTSFYHNDEKYINQICNIVNQNDIISLRILDWFITNYSKKYRTIIENNIIGISVDVYMHYKLMLKSYNKKSFDPFSRKNKIVFYYKDDCNCDDDCPHYIETSCGQLTFFKWCFENQILEYVKAHLEIIEKDMKDSLKVKKDADGNICKRKRQPLSVSAARSISKQHIKYTMHFE